MFFDRVLVNPAVDEDGRVILPDNGTNDGRGRSVADAAAGDCPIGENDGPLQRAAAPRLLADASSDANLAADLRRPFDWLTSRRMHNVARHRSATLLQDNTRENRDNQVDCPVTNTVCNDEALTSGGERFVSSSTNPDRVTHDLGLGKAIVVRFRTLDTNNWDALLIFLEKLRSQDVSCETQIAKISQIKDFSGGITSSAALNQPAINGLDSNTPPVDGIPVTQIQHPKLRPVTDQKRQQVIELYRAGSSIVEIVERSGVSRSSIHRICRKEGLLRRPRGLSQQHR